MKDIQHLIEQGCILKESVKKASNEDFLTLLDDIETWQKTIENHTFDPQTPETQFVELQNIIQDLVLAIEDQKQNISAMLLKYKQDKRQGEVYRDIATKKE